MKKTIILFLAVLMLFSAVACTGKNDSDYEYIKNKGKIIIGITDFEPMDYKDNGEWTGFDAELALLVFRKLGVEVEFQEINWKTKESELAGKTIDCIWNGLTWDSDRAENMSMSDYYMINRQVIVVKNANSDKYTNIKSFDGMNIAAESGSAGEALISKDMEKARLIEKDSQIDALTELVAGTVDAAVIDFTMANYLINKEGSDFSGLKILDGIVESQNEYYAIAFRRGSDITERINKILSDLKKSGEIADIAKKYGLENALVK